MIPLIASVAMLLAGITYVILWAGRPGDCTAIDPRPESWRANGVVVDAIEACSIRTDDVVVAVDGHSLSRQAPATDIADGQTLDYRVDRGGDELTVPVVLAKSDLLDRLAPAWSTLLFVASLLAVAAYVVWRKPDSATRMLLILASGLAASTLPTLLGLPVIGLLQPIPHWLFLLLTQVIYLTAWTAGLAFSLLFPRPYGPTNRWRRGALVTAPLWAMAGVAAASAAGSPGVLAWTSRVIAGGAVVIVVTQLAIVAFSVLQLRRAADALERQQMRWLVGSTVLAISVGLAGWLIPQILLGEGLPTQWIGLAGLPFVLGLGVALLRYRLFDLDVVLNRGLVYGLLTVSVVTVYMAVVTALANVMGGSSTTPCRHRGDRGHRGSDQSVAGAAPARRRSGNVWQPPRPVHRAEPPWPQARRRWRGGQLLPSVAEDIADACACRTWRSSSTRQPGLPRRGHDRPGSPTIA